MSQLEDVGISPVLLQAISQSITTASSNTRHPATTSDMETTNTDNTGKLQRQPLSDSLGDKGQEINSEAVKTMLKIKMAANAISKSLMNEESSLNLGRGEDKSPYTTSTISDLAMANMLTALASQSDRTSVVSSNGGSQSISDVGEITGSSSSDALQQRIFVRSRDGDLIQQSMGKVESNSLVHQGYTEIKQEMDRGSEYDSDITSRLQSSNELTKSNITLDLDPNLSGSQPRYIIKSKSSDNIESQSLPETVGFNEQDQVSSATVLVSDNPDQTSTVLDTVLIPQARGQLIEYGGKQYLLHPSSTDGSSKYIAIRTSDIPSTSEDSDIYTTVAGHEIVSVTEADTGDGMNVGLSTMQVYTGDGPKTNYCPICGDEISGFHYGIFTCESCKGFFKRTVQNKKSFVCHRQGECEINLENRKKCPACRFAKCLVMGMKLDAIRQDRSRGGRSSYSGLSPLDEAKRKRHMKPVQKRPVNTPSTSDGSRLASALSYDSQSVGKPFVPPVLTDIMNLESLLCDDDIPQNIKADDFIASNPSVFLTLLQLCELKLYKIVRWARNLPYFANISTDDQILLLQNCWCELLALTMCWKSIHLNNEIVFFHGQTIDLEKARLLTLGNMFLCMLAEVEQLKRLRLDQYEFVAMKVIILITPDIKGLNDADRLAVQQQKISEALEQYTSSHYKQNLSKYGELLLRLPELSRISFMLKEQLLSWMPHDNTSCGLLYELLKGENMKELV